MSKSLFPFPYTKLQAAIANFVDETVLPSGQKAAQAPTQPLQNFVFKGMLKPDKTIEIMDITTRKQKFFMSCRAHPEAGLFETSFRYLFDGSNSPLKKTFCRFCRKDAGIGRNFTTLSEIRERLKNDPELGWLIDDDKSQTGELEIVKTTDHLHLICIKTIPGSREICRKSSYHNWGNIQSALHRKQAHIVCQGDCDSKKKNKDKRLSLHQFYDAMPERFRNQWRLANPAGWLGISAWYDVIHEPCGHAIYRFAQSFIDYGDAPSSTGLQSFGCPFCDRTSPLQLLNGEVSRYKRWVSEVTNGVVALVSMLFPDKDSEKLGLICNRCESLYEATQSTLLNTVYFGCKKCSETFQKQPRAWKLADAQTAVSERGFKLINDPGNYIKDAEIVSEEGQPTPYTSVMDLCNDYPYTANGPAPIAKSLKKNNVVVEPHHHGKPYTASDDALLNANANKISYSQLAILLGRTESAIKKRFRDLGLYNNERNNYGRIKDLDDSVFDNLSPDACYWAGLLAADGCITQGKNADIKLELKVSDEAHLGSFLRFLRSDDKLSYRTMKGVAGRGLYASMRFRSKNIQTILQRIFKIGPKKSYILEQPKLSSKTQIRAFLLGVFDGDGHIKRNSRGDLYCHIISASPTFIEWCIEQVRELVDEPAMNLRETKSESGTSHYNIDIHTNKAERFMSALYENSNRGLLRKKRIFELSSASSHRAHVAGE